MGNNFVAFAALCTLLQDSKFAKEALNVPDCEGLTPLGLALNNHTERKNRSILYNNGTTKAYDCSIYTYYSDYPDAIALILANPHLSLSNMFEESANPGHVSKKLRLDVKIGYSMTMINPELLVLWRYSKLERTSFLGKLLEDGSGGVPGESKAVSLILCIGKEYEDDWKDVQWFFKPASLPKEPGAFVRKLLQKQAGPCILAIGELRRNLQRKAKELQNQTNDIATLTRREKRARKRSIAKAKTDIHQVWDVLNSEIPDFFLGGIYSCLIRKHNMTADIWNHILEFGDWKMKFEIMLQAESF